jgi:hypothetical protein
MALLSQRTNTDLDDLIVEAVKRHIPFWFVQAGVVLAIRLSPLAPEYHVRLDRFAAALFVVSVSLAGA